MKDDTMTINLKAPVFNGKEEEWPEFIVKFKKGEGPKVMCGEIEALKVNYWDKAEILDNDGVWEAVQVRTDTSSSGSRGQ